jgi:hypothetical protein
MTSFSEPRICASTQCVTAPIGISFAQTSLAPAGITDETATRFCSPIPMDMSAMSNAFRSETSLDADADVTKNSFGTRYIQWPSRWQI